MNDLFIWSDISCFKSFCLDRLAVGLDPKIIAEEVSSFVGHVVPVEQVLASNPSEAISARRDELLEEVRSSAPVISRELLSILGKTKKFIERAESQFNDSPQDIADFDAYRRSLELQLKAIDVAFSNLGKLTDSQKQTTNIVLQFGVKDLERLEASGAIKVIDVSLAGELIGDKSLPEAQS